MTMARLFITGDIQEDESLPGYLIRLSHANGVRPSLLTNLTGLPIGYEHRSSGFLQLASLSGSDPEVLRRASFAPEGGYEGSRFNGSSLSRRHLVTDGARVCPECVKERGYLDRLWHLRAFAACHRHQLLLIDRCKACARPIQWQRRKLDRCDCGHVFERGGRAPEWLVEYTQPPNWMSPVNGAGCRRPDELEVPHQTLDVWRNLHRLTTSATL
ncbi:TniQ family protein [Brevundimonas sp.]|uniref:TniQ family protein n=1 Tax=Brevundimonas sp. TaxID=1871086 RepID=UPI003D09734E